MQEKRRACPAREVQEMVVLAMFNLVLLLLNFFIGLRTQSKTAATPSMLPPEAMPETQERTGRKADAPQAETWIQSESVPVFAQLGETTQRS